MAGRRRNRRRRRSQQQRVSALKSSSVIRAHVEKARAAFIANDKAYQEHKHSVKNSAGVRASEATKKQAVVAYISNIPWNATAVDLVAFLAQNMPIVTAAATATVGVRSIVCCDILTHRGSGQSRGAAFVTLSNEAALNALLAVAASSTGMRLSGRLLKVRHAHNRNPRADQTETNNRTHKISQLQFGAPFMTQLLARSRCRNRQCLEVGEEKWVCQWSSTDEEEAEVHLNGGEKMLAVEFSAGEGGRQMRLETRLKNIEPGSVQLQRDHRHGFAIVLCLQNPPDLFRRSSSDAARGIESSSSAQDLFEFPLLQSSIRSRTLWQIGSSTAKHTPEWVRTVDNFSSNGAFGRCRCLRLAIGHGRNHQSLLQQLYRFGVLTSSPAPLPSCTVTLQSSPCLSSSSSNPLASSIISSWSGSKNIDAKFAACPYPVLYLLQGLVSANRIDLIAAHDQHTLTSFVEAVLATPIQFTVDALEQMLSLETVHYYHHFSSDCRLCKSRSLLQCFLESVSTATSASIMSSSDEAGDDDDGDDDSDDADDAEDITSPSATTMSTTLLRRVSVSPLRVVVHAAEKTGFSNRVLRAFPEGDRFIMVHFSSERLGSFIASNSEDTLNHRVRRVLDDGVWVGGRHFVFLAFSSSQLREHGAWFYDETRAAMTAEQIRVWMGDLSGVSGGIGKVASRLGLGFSSTVGACKIAEHEFCIVEDLKGGNDIVFSDGVGSISFELASDVSKAMGLFPHVPSAFQVRFAGSKGVLTTSPPANNRIRMLKLRKSMVKFESEHRDLEVITTARYMPLYLNRQLITLLSAVGIPDEVFLEHQQNHVALLDMILTDNSAAERALRFMAMENQQYLPIRDMLSAGFSCLHEPHLHALLHALRARLLMDLQTRARVLVRDAVHLIGVVDEYNVLEPDTVFVQIQGSPDSAPTVLIRDRVVVGRNPSLHCGDLRVLSAVDVPQLRHLVNVVVFPAKGTQSLPSMMSGGDLDGDIFFVIWDKSLLPASQYPAMPPPPPPSPFSPLFTAQLLRELKFLDHAEAGTERGCSVDEIREFFCNYIANDRLGMIASAFVVHADVQEQGAKAPVCERLAALHSVAVDFAKTGIAAEFPPDLRPPPAYPDFVQNSNRPSYVSSKVLGKMFRSALLGHASALSSGASCSCSGRNDASSGIDTMKNIISEMRSIMPLLAEFEPDAEVLSNSYNARLTKLMGQFGVFDEAQICSGFVRKFARKMAKKDRRASDLMTRLNAAFRDLQRHFREIFWEDLPLAENVGGREELHWIALNKAAAWYLACYDPHIGDAAYEDGPHHHQESSMRNKRSIPLLSFAWIMHELVCEIKRLLENK